MTLHLIRHGQIQKKNYGSKLQILGEGKIIFEIIKKRDKR